MLTDHFESFTLLDNHMKPDELGGSIPAWQDVIVFRGGLTHTATPASCVSGRMVLRSEPVLLHETDVTLQPGDHIRRERDGSLWRVTSASGDLRTPAVSGLNFAQVCVERVVCA